MTPRRDVGERWPTRHHRLAPATLYGAFAFSVVAVIAVFIAFPDGLPTRFVVAIHEGTTRDSVAQLFGLGGHGEVGFGPWLRLAGPDDTVRLPRLAALNLATWLATFALWWVVVARIARGAVLAAVLVAVCLASLPGLNSALSESPAALLSALTGIAALVLGFGDRATPLKRLVVAVPALAWAATVRFEWALLGLGVLVGEGVMAAVPPARLDAWRAGFQTRMSVAARRFGWGWWPALVVVALAAAEVWGGLGALLPVEDGDPYRVWITTAVGALPSHIVSTGFALWHVLPGAVVLLACIGFVHACVHPLKWRLLPFSVALLASLYVAAAHGQSSPAYFEIERYFAPLLPFVAVFAGAGAWWLVNRVDRSASPRAWRVIVAFVAIVGSVPLSTWPQSVKQLSAWQAWIDENGELSLPLDHDVQREVRLLLRTLDDAPECAVITILKPIPSMRMADDDGRYLALSRDRSKVLASRTMADARRELAHDFAPMTCLRVVHGLDCNVRGDNHCDVDTARLEPLVREGFTTRAYTHPTERHSRPSRTVLAVYGDR